MPEQTMEIAGRYFNPGCPKIFQVTYDFIAHTLLINPFAPKSDFIDFTLSNAR